MKQDPFGDLEQLALGLDGVESGEDRDSGMSPEAARLHSEAARFTFEQLPRLIIPRAGEETWFEDYLRLKEAGFTWRIAAFIAWAASPKIGRWPKTQEELASKVLGLSSDRAIGNWRRKNLAIDAVIATMQSAPLIDHRRDIYKALIDSASKADHRSHPDRRLALELLGDYTPHMKVEDARGLTGSDLTGLSDEELEILSQKIIGKNPPKESPLPPLCADAQGGLTEGKDE